MRKILPLVLLFMASCQDNRVGEDFWYGNAEMLCQREHCPRCAETRGITCPNCDGSGEETCKRCGGNGKLTCNYCDGSGKLDGVSCPYCDGKGVKTCDKCGGDGEQTCDVCSGKRKVACIQKIPVHQTPATSSEDAWPPNNFKGAGVDN